jgi:hypothetical protein
MTDMIKTKDRIPHTIAKTTKTNTQEMIAADHPREILPTPRRASHVAQAITTETVHHYMKRKRSSRKLSRSPRSTQHHRKVSNAQRVTRPRLHSSEETRKDKNIKRKDKIINPIKRPSHLTNTTMKLGNGILKTSIQDLSDENFHFYNWLVLRDDLDFQRTHFRITPPNIPRLYQHDAASNDNDDLPLQNRSSLQNNELINIAVIIATHECTKETTHSLIDSGASCCVTPYIEDFLHQPIPIQNTTLKGIAGGLTTLGRGTVQLKIHQENKENAILIIDNVIYAPYCPIRLISPQQLHRQSNARKHEKSCCRQKKPLQPYFTGEIHSRVITILKQKSLHFVA